ncbi:MAG: hypothetical protein HY873_13170 [Chloroflexi bacterium]|nr:hypothetical protein [Chloroflexota bacterium]
MNWKALAGLALVIVAGVLATTGFLSGDLANLIAGAVLGGSGGYLAGNRVTKGTSGP